MIFFRLCLEIIASKWVSNSFSVFAVALALNEPSKSVWHPRSTRDRSPSSFTSSIPNKASASLANKPRSRISFTQQNLKRVLFSRKKLANSLHSKVLQKHLQKSTGKEISTFSSNSKFKQPKEEFFGRQNVCEFICLVTQLAVIGLWTSVIYSFYFIKFVLFWGKIPSSIHE